MAQETATSTSGVSGVTSGSQADARNDIGINVDSSPVLNQGDTYVDARTAIGGDTLSFDGRTAVNAPTTTNVGPTNVDARDLSTTKNEFQLGSKEGPLVDDRDQTLNEFQLGSKEGPLVDAKDIDQSVNIHQEDNDQFNDQKSEQKNENKQEVKVKYPKPLPFIPAPNTYQIIAPSEWPKGDETPLIFRTAQGIVPGLWIAPSMTKEMRLVPVEDRMNPMTFVTERDKRELYTRIHKALTDMESWAPECEVAIISTELVDKDDVSDGKGAGLSIGKVDTSGWGANFQTGYNHSSARSNLAYRVVILFLENPKPIVKTAPTPKTELTPEQKSVRDFVLKQQRIRREALDESIASTRRDSGIAPCDPSQKDER